MPGAEVVLRKQEQWDGFKAELVRRTGLQRQEIHVSGDRHAIFLNMEGAARLGENYLDGVRTAFVVRAEGSIAYVPPGRSWTGWDEGDDRAAYLFISVEKDFAGELFDNARNVDGLKPELGFHDLSIQFAARKIAAELPNADYASGMIVEGHLTTIFGHLLRRAAQSDEPRKGGLAPAVLKRAKDRLDDAVEDNISMSSLCRELGMSTAHFCRAFKQSMGITPHAYLNKRRVERASLLLRTTSLSVTEIALMCGYSSGSHFSTSFRQELAVPPVVYRSVWS